MSETVPNVREEVRRLIDSMPEIDKRIFRSVLLIEQKYLHVETTDSQMEILKCIKDEVSKESALDEVKGNATSQD